jgi:hypothetical protein
VICGEGRVVVTRSPQQVLEFVLDLERYRQADHKIGRIYDVRRDPRGATVRFRPRFRGLPAPVVTQRLDLTPWSRIDVSDEPSWMGRLTRFTGVVECTESSSGTVVVHRECLTFRGPLRLLMEPALRRWLARDTAAETERLGALLEG